MIKNVILDCGNVLINYDEHYISSFFADDENDIDILAKTAMSRKYWDAFDAGTLTSEVYKVEVKKELPEHLHKAAEGICDKWTSYCPPISGMRELVRDVNAKGTPLYLLSNFNQRLRAETDIVFPELELFDGLVISGEIGIVKPSKEIYKYIIEKYCLVPEECVFIDDNKNNIAACEEAGIVGYLFDGDAEKLRQYLKDNDLV